MLSGLRTASEPLISIGLCEIMVMLMICPCAASLIGLEPGPLQTTSPSLLSSTSVSTLSSRLPTSQSTMSGRTWEIELPNVIRSAFMYDARSPGQPSLTFGGSLPSKSVGGPETV